jgi:hypothetical protein
MIFKEAKLSMHIEGPLKSLDWLVSATKQVSTVIATDLTGII